MSNAFGTSGIDEGIPTSKIQHTQVGQEDTPDYPQSKLHTFLKENVQSLGVAQIMIGLKCFLFGVIWSFFPLSTNFRKIFSCFYTGYPFWATMSFIISGSLTILSAKKPTKFLIGVNIGANIISTVLSSIGMLLLSSNLFDIFFFDCSEFSECSLAKSYTTSIVILQMILTSVEISISFSLSGLTYNMNGTEISWFYYNKKNPKEEVHLARFGSIRVFPLCRQNMSPSQRIDVSHQSGKFACTLVSAFLLGSHYIGMLD